ncbi:hypothetical protein BpHYR1_034325 [Brachionus plicatilis]|uniref:Uncharacterized protein n=1 Tax=Brachionus plicatilis TaxID=10195 RepID=A0A3M7RUT6_BRAPC|nr:hypothetical protein BpHYR1_034325 [Brachionus plicatilis]
MFKAERLSLTLCASGLRMEDKTLSEQDCLLKILEKYHSLFHVVSVLKGYMKIYYAMKLDFFDSMIKIWK